MKNVIVSKTREGGGAKMCRQILACLPERANWANSNSSKSVETFLSKCSAPKIFGFYINWRHIWNQTKVILYLAVGSWNYSSLALATVKDDQASGFLSRMMDEKNVLTLPDGL